MTRLDISLLGSPQFLVDNTEATGFNTRKDRALLAYLAVTRTAHSRETLATLLWSELPEDKARRNLRHALFHLQKVIGAQWITTERGVALTQNHPWSVDVHTLQAAVKNFTTSPIADKVRHDAQLLTTLDQALQLYRGEFLQGFHLHDAVHFEEWVLAQREASHLLVLRGLEALVKHHLAQGAYEQGLTATRRLLQLEPWSELAHRLHMQLLAQSGRRAEALAQYEKCRQILADELGVGPEPATIALYKQLRDQPSISMGQPTSAIVLPPPELAPAYFVPTLSHNLPGQLTSFIGRSDDIRHIRTLLLSAQQRLITVVGEGGIGKTRLALAVAQSFVDETQALASQSRNTMNAPMPAASARVDQPFPDGIVFVPLGGLTVTNTLIEQLVAAVAKALQFQFASKEPLLRQLQDHLRDKAILLLFDNVEHLLPDVADFLVELLRSAPQLKILVTSRRLLNLQAEHAVRPAGLPTPQPQEVPILTSVALLAYSSVVLFVERAQRANVTFQVTATNQTAIVQICHFVNGLPLAIELAATLTRQYTCQQILDELQKSYKVLSSTLRDLVPRHRSIRALLDYSWQFLSPETAHLLATCSIFRGSFSRTAVAAIMDATLEPLFSLVDQSLLQLLPNGEDAGQARFALHQLIHQYAAEQLQLQPTEMYRLRTAHCRYYLTLLTEQSRIFVQDWGALQQMQNEIDNLRAAWEWAGAQGQWDLLTASAYPLRQFYSLLSLLHEAESHFGRAIEQVQQFQAHSTDSRTTQDRLVAYLQIQQARFCDTLDQNAKAEALAQSAIELGQQLDDHAIQGHAYLGLSMVYGHRTDWASAQHAAEQAWAHARTGALPNLEAQSLQNIGCTYLYRGDTSQALDYLHRALTQYRALATISTERDLHMEGVICLDVGMSYQLAGDLMQARAYYQQSVEIYRQMSIPILGVYAMCYLSELHLQLGQNGQASADAQLALDICRSMGSRTAEGTALGHLAYAYYRLGDLVKADHACQVLLDRIQPLGLTLMRPFAYFIQGELRHSQSQWQAALTAYETARQDYIATEQTAQAISTQLKIAQVWLQVGYLSKALAKVEETLPQLSQTSQTGWRETSADYLICYQVLATAHDPRATTILQQGYQYVQAQAAHLTDATLRHSYLTNVTANRSLVKLAKHAGIH